VTPVTLKTEYRIVYYFKFNRIISLPIRAVFMAEPLSDPRTYFKFQSCGRCFYKPCDGLRYGGVIAGKFLFVHNSHLGLGFFDCPFTVQAFDEVERLTEGLSSSELDSRLSDAYGLMTPAQILQYRMDDYIADYSDFGGRIAFIKALWDDQVISILRIPLFFTADPKMRKWLYANENLMYSLKKTVVDDGLSGAAATDNLADKHTTEKQQSLSEPRWKHTDAQREKASPNAAALGDVVRLIVFALGFDDGAQIAFDIFDTSSSSPKKIDSVQGIVNSGKAQANWTIKDPNKNGEKLKLEFEACAKSLKSGKYMIALVMSTIQIKYPLEDPHKQFVNLLSNGSDNGNELKVEVSVKNASDNLPVFWRLSAHSDNSKRSDKTIGLKDPATGSSSNVNSGVAKISTKTKGETAEAVVCCGVAGGDSFDLEVGLQDDVWLSKIKIENWRKLWYQVTRPDTLSVPALSYAITAYKKVFIELIQADGKQFSKSTVPDRTYYKEWMLQKGGSDNNVAVIGSHNKEHFFNYYVPEKDKPVKAHLVICQHQWDEGDITRPLVIIMSNNISDPISTFKTIFSPPLAGNLVLAGMWSSNAPSGHPDYGKRGHIVDENIIVEKNRPSLQHIRIKLPEGVISPDKINTVTVKLILRGVNGPYLGESSGNNMLIVYDPKNVRDFNNTISHEIGHAVNQTPLPGKQAPSLPNHPRQYTGHGGIGSHCNTAKGQIAGKLNIEKEYSSGICVMFHAGDDSCINEFCNICASYVKATDISGFHQS
jgi:hypothetical protein